VKRRRSRKSRIGRERKSEEKRKEVGRGGGRKGKD
jgi:hypothetical protein